MLQHITRINAVMLKHNLRPIAKAEPFSSVSRL